ncbi:MAG: hypothetical protein LQ343_004684 [Gyalolechia ehrenbergii]|nr:MAG: hypothetical protein LQ343_004684 [Gyalolechia ehrenbergii]
MVSRVGRTTPYQRPQAHATNGDVPPSSKAAQLADKLANARQDSSDQDQQNFNLLLQEILDGNDHVWQADRIADSDAPASSRLIQVIVQAGLSTHCRGDSNAASPRKPSDVVRSLRAIDLTLSRCPDAFFQPLAFDSSSGFPLFAWLIPKVLVEISDCEFQDIGRLVLKLIQRSWTIAERATTQLRSTSQVLHYFRGLITGIYSDMQSASYPNPLTSLNKDLVYSIETWDFGKNGARTPVYPPAPISETISEVFPDHCEDEDGISSIQVTPRSASQAFITAYVLLSGSVPPLDELCSTPYDHHLALLESTLHYLGRTWVSLTTNGYSVDRPLGTCLEILLPCLRNLLEVFVKVAAASVAFSKATILLSQVLSVALENDFSTSSPSLESEICLTLADVSDMASDSTAVSQVFSEHLLPMLSQPACSRENSATLIEAIKASSSLIEMSRY